MAKNNKANSSLDDGASTAGQVGGNVSNAATTANQQTESGKNRFTVNSQAHGPAAEQANHLRDTLTGHKTKLVGDDIDKATGRKIKNGADRIVDGIEIQSKYCKTGSACVNECFADKGKGEFRYWNSEGKPMQIEVPSDQYDSAVQAMAKKIRRGQVNGVTDPAEAKNIIRKGHFTYEQVKNIAKAGTVESIIFDASNGAIIATCAFGITSLLSFAVSIWNGKDLKESLNTAASAGLKVGGVTFISAVFAGQLTKAGFNSVLVAGSETIVRIMGPKASALLVNAFRSGVNIYGAAAMKSAAKLLRGNFITGVVSFSVLSIMDVTNSLRGLISGKQLCKNLASTGATVVGGTVGWTGGVAGAAALGATIGSVIPGLGTLVGGAVGATVGGIGGTFVGSAVAGKVSNALLGRLIYDAGEMVKIIKKEFQQISQDYLLNKSEAEHIEKLINDFSEKTLKDMFKSINRKAFAYNLLINLVTDEVSKRKYIQLPSDIEMSEGLKEVLEQIADEKATIMKKFFAGIKSGFLSIFHQIRTRGKVTKTNV